MEGSIYETGEARRQLPDGKVRHKTITAAMAKGGLPRRVLGEAGVALDTEGWRKVPGMKIAGAVVGQALEVETMPEHVRASLRGLADQIIKLGGVIPGEQPIAPPQEAIQVSY